MLLNESAQGGTCVACFEYVTCLNAFIGLALCIRVVVVVVEVVEGLLYNSRFW